MNLTCNSTLEEMRISPGSEIKIAGPLNFHDLARIIGAGTTLISVVLSLYLIWMHATHYTQPREQRHIIRILFMAPVYAVASFMQIQWYWQAVYFQIISDCYEAFAIASFYALLVSYCGPDLHTQKEFFRHMRPIKPWVIPVNWFAKCCGGERGPWRTPKSGLTWFNIIWVGVYQYCFIRVAMTITAVLTQHWHRYCESSNSPVFAHIWTLIINSLAVTIAMYCLIQFYVQLSKTLAEHKLFIKILAIKLVVFLSFWQSTAISIGTSTLKLVHPNKVLAYPDLKVGIPALLLCVEMALFSILHLWAFPYSVYRESLGRRGFYPSPDPAKGGMGDIEKTWPRNEGGFMGIRAMVDAMNPWDIVKAFGRGMRWLFVGVKKRHEDASYNLGGYNDDTLHMGTLPENKVGQGSYSSMQDPSMTAYHGVNHSVDESQGLIYNAQPNPEVGVMEAASPPTAYHSQGIHESSYPQPYSQEAHESSYPQPYSQGKPYDPPPYRSDEHAGSSYASYELPASGSPARPARPEELPTEEYSDGPWRPSRQ